MLIKKTSGIAYFFLYINSKRLHYLVVDLYELKYANIRIVKKYKISLNEYKVKLPKYGYTLFVRAFIRF